MSIGNKIKLLREEKNMSQSELAKVTQVSEKTIRRYEKGEAYKIDTVKKIAKALDLDINYFMNDVPQSVGQTSLTVSHTQKDKNSTKSVPHLSENNGDTLSNKELIKESDTIEIKRFHNIKASAGFGTMNYDLEYETIKINKATLRDVFNIASYKDLEIINVQGDSMMPYVQNGESVLFQRTKEVLNNQVCIIRVEDDIYIKRVKKDITSKTLTLVSDNPIYKDKVLKIDEIENAEIIGVVRGKFRLY